MKREMIMNTTEEKNITIVLLQYSVVAKGMERKLIDLGYHVDVISNRYNSITNYNKTDLFVIYLPTDIMDDMAKRAILEEICKNIQNGGRKMLFLGEKKYHAELSREVPVIDDHVWLDRPVDNETLSEVVENTIAGTLKGGRKRILIVDDDPSYAAMVKEWIRKDYRVETVTAGMQAITFLLKNPVDLILLDYEMPVVDGPQVLQMLRQENATKDIPVVFLTGVGTKEEVERVMSLHPSGYILKTTTKENLITFLKHKLV